MYDKQYYEHSLGQPYNRNNPHWAKFFGDIADAIVASLHPRTVLDAGCATGFLVESLRDRGVDAWGIDISTYALRQLPRSIRPYCKRASITDELDQHYDLIVCIEVLEHLPSEFAARAIENLAGHADRVLFSSTPSDFDEPTHVNVQPVEYWVRLFAQHGFYRDVDFDATFVTPHAVCFHPRADAQESIVVDYERWHRQLASELNHRKDQTEIEARSPAAEQELQRARHLLEDKDRHIANVEARAVAAETALQLARALQIDKDRHIANVEARAVAAETALQLARALQIDKDRHITNVEARAVAAEQALELERTSLADKDRHITNVEGRALAGEAALTEVRAEKDAQEKRASQAEMTLAAAQKEQEQQRRVWEINARQQRDAISSLRAAIGDKNTHIRNLEALLERRSQPWTRIRARRTRANGGLERGALAQNWLPVASNRPDLSSFQRWPKFSVVVPVRDPQVTVLRETITSVIKQSYPEWELCVADDGSNDPKVREVLHQFARADKRIRVIELAAPVGISGASNAALAMAEGDFVAFVDHDDLLHEDALLYVASTIEIDSELDIIYTDEDKLSDAGRHEDPYLKPDWSPDLLLANMYLGHLLVARRAVLNAVGGFRSEFDASQDYDLVLRLTERTSRIGHVPEVLYHWRRGPGSTATAYPNKPDAHLSARAALEDAVERRRLEAQVEEGIDPSTFRLRYPVPTGVKVSILIPTRDRADVLARCIDSLTTTIERSAVELMVIDNASVEPKTLRYLAELEGTDVKVVRYQEPFNYSAINNFGVSRCSGDVLLFLNNDTEAMAPGWLEALLELVMQPDIGVVGCKLLYPDEPRRIQHAGVILGIGGVAGHAHKGRADRLPGTVYGPNRIANYSAVTAACLAIRKDVFETVDGFDEAFAVAFNDVDLCLRVRSAGFRVVYTPFASLLHHESLSVGRPTDGRQVSGHEIDLMQKRWGPLLQSDPFYNRRLPRNCEDFTPWVHPQPTAAETVNNPIWMLPKIGLYVLRHYGFGALCHETARYIGERIRA